MLYCNRAAEAHFQIVRADVLGRVIWDLIPSPPESWLRRFLTAAMASRQATQAEVPSDVKAGRWVSLRVFPIEDGIGVSFRDVTERRERLRRERDQAERLELALAAAGFGDWSWDVASDLVTLSDRAAAVFGVPAGPHMTWRDMRALLHPDDRERARLAVNAAIAARGVYEIEYRIRRPVDGAERWVLVRARGLYDAKGRSTGMLGVLADVTAAKADAAQVVADRERLAILESRHGFLLQVADTLRALSDADDILQAAARLLGERLGVGRSGYAEIADDDVHLVVRGDWTAPGIPRLEGLSFPLEAFGPEAVAGLRAGKVLAVADIAEDPRTAPYADAYAGIHTRAILSFPLLRDGRFDAFFCATAPEPRAWSAEDLALVEEVAARTWSALGRARSERALRESEARFRAMADSAPAPVWVTGAAGPVEFVNRAFCELVGQPADALLGDAWVGLMHPEDRARVGALRAEARAKVAPYVFEARFRDAAGAWRLMRASSQPRFDETGVFQGYVGLAMDVTGIREAEARQRLLINELNHRVKNTLATVQSLAHQTLREGMVTREARTRLTDRLLALSAAHNVLTRENWESADLRDIVRQAIGPYDDALRPRFDLSGPSARLSPNVALALSMALHELATNAVKYGALSAPAGRVSVAWRRADDRIELDWRETGGPPVTAPSGKGFGSRLLAGLVSDLGAAAEIAYPASGLTCRLRAPVAA